MILLIPLFSINLVFGTIWLIATFSQYAPILFLLIWPCLYYLVSLFALIISDGGIVASGDNGAPSTFSLPFDLITDLQMKI